MQPIGIRIFGLISISDVDIFVEGNEDFFIEGVKRSRYLPLGKLSETQFLFESQN